MGIAFAIVGLVVATTSRPAEAGWRHPRVVVVATPNYVGPPPVPMVVTAPAAPVIMEVDVAAPVAAAPVVAAPVATTYAPPLVVPSPVVQAVYIPAPVVAAPIVVAAPRVVYPRRVYRYRY
jgi:hypothetical protein